MEFKLLPAWESRHEIFTSQRLTDFPPAKIRANHMIQLRSDTTCTRESLRSQFLEVRQASVEMCRPLRAEEYRIQPVPEISPPWWNLGHTTWFFARNILLPMGGEYTQQDQEYDFVLNSYYVSLGERVARDRRGSLTRPTTEEIYDYRHSVDERILNLIDSISESRLSELAWLLQTGEQHEQQHQELFYTEIKWINSEDAPSLRTAYRSQTASDDEPEILEPSVIGFTGGLFEFGNLEGGWCWDNELPVHKYFLVDFGIASRLVTNAEYLEFMDDRGYENQLLWLDNGWARKRSEGWAAPMYWERDGDHWQQWTLSGLKPVHPSEPVCHISFYEADAFARWKAQSFHEHRSARLLTEREWEHAARTLNVDPGFGNQLSSGNLHPTVSRNDGKITGLFGDVWEWTSSYYEPYPGYIPFAGSLAEYNSKFMDNQRVLRGGSCVTPTGHLRCSYRNFWSGDTRFQFTGLRLGYSDF